MFIMADFNQKKKTKNKKNKFQAYPISHTKRAIGKELEISNPILVKSDQEWI